MASSKLPAKKALMIGKLHPDTLQSAQELIDYFPGIGQENLVEWREILSTYQPTVIIFGSNVITADMLYIWREEMPHEALFLLRRGITLARCDLETAKQLKIQVFNTPHANTPFIAQFICANAFQKKNSKSGDHSWRR